MCSAKMLFCSGGISIQSLSFHVAGKYICTVVVPASVRCWHGVWGGVRYFTQIVTIYSVLVRHLLFPMSLYNPVSVILQLLSNRKIPTISSYFLLTELKLKRKLKLSVICQRNGCFDFFGLLCTNTFPPCSIIIEIYRPFITFVSPKVHHMEKIENSLSLLCFETEATVEFEFELRFTCIHFSHHSGNPK